MLAYLKRKFYFSKLLYIYLSHYCYIFPTLFHLHIFELSLFVLTHHQSPPPFANTVN